MSDPRFELHILPLMRAVDREHMRSRFDLWDYDQVVSHADALLSRLAVDMPTVATGGPWPPEWIALFQRWKDTGFKRLELGTAEVSRTRAGTKILVIAAGTFPAAGYRGWLQVEAETDTSKTYALYFDPPDSPATGSPAPFSLRERYDAADTRSVFIRDRTGTHDLPLTQAPPSPAVAALASVDDFDFFSAR